MARTVGRSSSRITSPHAPAYAARTWEELSPTQSRRSPPGARQATALQSWAPVDSDMLIVEKIPARRAPPGRPLEGPTRDEAPGLRNQVPRSRLGIHEDRRHPEDPR